MWEKQIEVGTIVIYNREDHLKECGVVLKNLQDDRSTILPIQSKYSNQKFCIHRDALIICSPPGTPEFEKLPQDLQDYMEILTLMVHGVESFVNVSGKLVYCQFFMYTSVFEFNLFWF